MLFGATHSVASKKIRVFIDDLSLNCVLCCSPLVDVFFHILILIITPK